MNCGPINGVPVQNHRWESAPALRLSSAFSPEGGLSSSLVIGDPMEVSPLSREMMLPELNLYPPD
jgi:hypothetical protein